MDFFRELRDELRILPAPVADWILEIVEGVEEDAGRHPGPGLLSARMAAERLAAYLESQRLTDARGHATEPPTPRDVSPSLPAGDKSAPGASGRAAAGGLTGHSSTFTGDPERPAAGLSAEAGRE